MKFLAVAFTLIAITTGCSRQPTPQRQSSQFFVGVDTTKLPEPAKSAVSAAEKDIELVLKGRAPACKSEADSAFSDGGTALYKCKYYDLTVTQSIYQIGDTYGVMYGPIVTFPNDYSVSYVRFYSNEALRELKSGR